MAPIPANPPDDPETRWAPNGRGWRLAGVLVLLSAALLRIWLVFGGGQFMQLDEARYLDGRAGASMILAGHVRQGLAYPLEGGDHVGSKELSLIPALIERSSGSDRVWIPALFFASFSVLSIGLIGGILFRYTRSRRAQFFGILAAGCSGALFYYARHLLPYDASMAFILFGLFLAAGPDLKVGRLVVAGLFAGFGFVIYYGSWSLAGFVLAMATLGGTPGWNGGYWKGVFLRGLSLAAGLVLAIALPVWVNSQWGSGHLIQGARGLSASIVIGDFRGHRIPWEYLWYTDYLELPLAVLFAVVGVAALGRDRSVPGLEKLHRPETLAFACFLGVYAMLIVTGTLMHKFAVHDRLIREMVPFLMLGCGFGLEAWCAAGASRRALSLVVLLFAGNAAFAFYVPLVQQWPAPFKSRADKLLAQRTDPDSPDAYFRYVNVMKFYFQAEAPKAAPLETLARERSFLQYYPYLYEAKTPEDRLRRESVDSSMRLVKMPVLPDSRIQGPPYGTVTMRVRFAKGRSTFLEPLLSMGKAYDGDVFFVHVYADDRLALGYFSTGQLAREGPLQTVDPSREHTIELFCGDLIDPAERPLFGRRNGEVWAKLDGATVLSLETAPKDVSWKRVYAGVNAVFEDYTETEFSGDVLSVQRTSIERFKRVRTIAASSQPFAVRIEMACPPPREPGPEPLLSAGLAGQADLVFLRRRSDGTVSVGCDVWGVGAPESAPLRSRYPDRDVAEIQLGSVQPPVGAAGWGALPSGEQAALRGLLVIRWNGQEVLRAAVPAWTFKDSSVDVGRNAVGGSLVRASFTGTVDESGTEPLISDRP